MDDVFTPERCAPEARPARIQDPEEVVRWHAEGRTDRWMSEEYERRYNITAPPSLWVHFRAAQGLTRHRFRPEELVPWVVHERHRRAFPLEMLLLEVRRRSGAQLAENDAARLATWTRKLTERGLVVHYDPATHDGFDYVPRRAGVDSDLVRLPGR